MFRWSVAAAVPTLILLSAFPATAGQPGPSAEAASTLVPGQLLPSHLLVHWFPQAASGVRPHVRAVSGTSLGAFAPVGDSARVFALSQSFTGISVDTRDFLGGALVQTGVAGHFGPLRWGAATRGTLSNDRNLDEQTDSFDPSGFGSLNVGATDESYLEFAVGAGLGDGRTFFDLVLETYREDFSTEALRTVRRSSTRQDTIRVDRDADRVFRGSAAVRIGFPGPADWDWLFWGAFQDRSAEGDQRVSDSTGVQNRRFEWYGHQWSTGFRLSQPPSRASRVSAYAFYANSTGREPLRAGSIYSSIAVLEETMRNETVTFGVTLERDIPYEFVLQVGMRDQFIIETSDEFRLESDGDTRSSSLTDELLKHGFGWGVRRDFREFRVTASMATDLALARLFGTVDVEFWI